MCRLFHCVCLWIRLYNNWLDEKLKSYVSEIVESYKDTIIGYFGNEGT